MDNLTDQTFWDDYWDKKILPLEIKREDNNLYLNEILNVFDNFLPANRYLSVLEIGGSPGQYLAYLYQKFGYQVHCLDYSKVGCDLTRENFRLLGIPGIIYQQDIMADNADLPLFDIVYSLGFIEHFEDTTMIIRKHLDLIKPGGYLLIGVPNMLGINLWFLKRLAPQFLSKHNLPCMNIATWNIFEDTFQLQTIFKGYIGGFEPGIFNKCENRTIINRLIKLLVHILTQILRQHFKLLRKLNSKFISGYAVGVYKSPALTKKYKFNQ